eukprot:403338616
MVILILPKNFMNGGYIASPMTLIVSSILTTICALKLVEAGLKLKIYDFSGIGEKAMGFKGKLAIDMILMITYFSFLISQVAYLYESVVSLYTFIGIDLEQIGAASAVTISFVYFMLAQQQDLKKFSFAFVLGSSILAIVCLKIIIYCGIKLFENGIGPSLEAVKPQNFWGTFSFSIYVYEGIGTIMPTMKVARDQKQFPKILIYAVTTLTIVFIIFGNICYLTFGQNLTEPIILSMIPSDNIITILIKIIFCIQLLCSYPICAYLVNTIAESYIFGSSFNDLQKVNYTPNNTTILRQSSLEAATVEETNLTINQSKTINRNSQNIKLSHPYRILLRCTLVILCVYMAIFFAKKLDKFFSLMGALLCAPIVFTLPTLCHLKICAQTQREKFIDWSIIIGSLFVLVFCTYESIKSWDS